MHVLIASKGVIPAIKYGGIERCNWYLGKELARLGHKVTYLVSAGSSCPFAEVLILDPNKQVASQIPDNIDVAHIVYNQNDDLESVNIPYVSVIHVNIYDERQLSVNSLFVSKNHANRYGSDVFAYNGMDWDDYGPVQLNNRRTYFHYLADARWSIKNVRGAIQVIKKTNDESLHVLGGTRLNFNMGFRFTLSPRTTFHGMVGGGLKHSLIQGSKGLIFPVIWHEPFGVAIIESLFFGCPVFGTPYGSLPELISEDVGFLSSNASELALAVENVEDYSRRRCLEYARDQFNSAAMTQGYLALYERVLNGEQLNKRRPTLINTLEDRKLPWS